LSDCHSQCCGKTTNYQNRSLGYLTSPVPVVSLWQNVG
jgi:hypothetical protein